MLTDAEIRRLHDTGQYEAWWRALDERQLLSGPEEEKAAVPAPAQAPAAQPIASKAFVRKMLRALAKSTGEVFGELLQERDARIKALEVRLAEVEQRLAAAEAANVRRIA